MTPSEIEPGTTIFIDANILLYAISAHWKHGKSSKYLLDAVDRGEFSGLTSVLVCNEIFHRSMVAEIIEKKNIDPGSAVKFLKENPELVEESNKAWIALKSIKKIQNLKIAGIDEGTLELALVYSKKYGLLSNDAFHLATMKHEGVTTMASNDRDFERVEWVSLWKP